MCVLITCVMAVPTVIRVSYGQRVPSCGQLWFSHLATELCHSRTQQQEALSWKHTSLPVWTPLFFFFSCPPGVAFLPLPVLICSCSRYTVLPPKWTLTILINPRVFYTPAQKQHLIVINHFTGRVFTTLCFRCDPH